MQQVTKKGIHKNTAQNTTLTVLQIYIYCLTPSRSNCRTSLGPICPNVIVSKFRKS